MSIKGAYRAGQAFASEHLRELAEEVVEWRNTGILRDGKMRELASITRELNAADALGIAEAYVVAKALELASQADVARDAVPDDDDRQLLAVIDARDRRDDIIDQLCDAVLGPDRAEWSSAYGFDNAVDDVRDAIESLARNAERWRAVRSNTGNGLRVIQWNTAAIEELQVMFPSPVLCDEEADAMTAQRGEGHS